MSESLFERITTSDVSQALTLLALIAFGGGLAVFLVVGLWRRRGWRCAVFGLLVAVAAALLWLGWQLVAARTSHCERIEYQQGRQEAGGTPFLPTPEYDQARERQRYSSTDPMFRGARSRGSSAPPSRAWWAWVPPGRLDSAGNVVLLAALFAAGGLAVGLACGWAWRRWRGEAAP